MTIFLIVLGILGLVLVRFIIRLLHRRVFRKKFLSSVIFWILLCMGGWYWWYYKIPFVPKRSDMLAQIQLYFEQDRNYRQTRNGCWPFTASAVINWLYEDKQVDPLKIEKTMKRRFTAQKHTHPWGVETTLIDQWLNIFKPNMYRLDTNRKLRYLQYEISQGNPVILLGNLDGYQHFLSLWGYDREKMVFYVYDSVYQRGEDWYTLDHNWDLPGNVNYTYDELLRFWKWWGKWLFYRWYALVVEKD